MGTAIIRQGQPVDHVTILCHGRVQLWQDGHCNGVVGKWNWIGLDEARRVRVCFGIVQKFSEPKQFEKLRAPAIFAAGYFGLLGESVSTEDHRLHVAVCLRVCCLVHASAD